MNVLPDVYICSHRKKISPLLCWNWGGDCKIYASRRIANSQRIQTEVNESGTIAKITI